MKTAFTILLSLGFLLIGNTQNLKTISEFSGYIPSSIRDKPNDSSFIDEFGRKIDINNLTSLDLFNHINTTVTIVDDSENIGGFGVTYDKGVYKVIYSFEIYLEAFDKSKNKCRLGASIEVVGNIKTNRKNLDLSSLFNLAIQAGKNKLRGSISMTAKGFNTDTIYGLFNINASIDKASVQQVLKNVGIMISKFTDKTITLKPIVLGYESKRGSE